MPSIWIGELECYDCGLRFKRRYVAELAEQIDRGRCDNPDCPRNRTGLGKPYLVFHRLYPDPQATARLRKLAARELARPIA